MRGSEYQFGNKFIRQCKVLGKSVQTMECIMESNCESSTRFHWHEADTKERQHEIHFLDRDSLGIILVEKRDAHNYHYRE